MPDLAEMVALKASSVRAATLKAEESGAMTLTPSGACILSRAIPEVAEGIRAWITSYSKKVGSKPLAYDWFRKMPPEVAALVGGRRILDSVSTSSAYPALCLAVGKLLIEEASLRQAARSDKDVKGKLSKIARNKARRAKKSKLAKALTSTQRAFAERKDSILVGMQFIQLFIERTGLIELKTVRQNTTGKTRESVRVIPTEGLLDWAKNYNERLPLLRPTFLPLSIPPTPWTGATGGGYGPESGRGERLVIGGLEEQDDAVDGAERREFLDAVNAVQATPWAVNDDVLEVLKALWAEGSTDGDLPSRAPIPFPTRPDPWIDGSPEARSWKRNAAATATMNDRAKSLIVATARTIWMAERLRRETKFWYPMFLDFRGRMYPRTGFIHPQASDLGRALLMFAEGRAVGTEESVEWLKIHGANCYGVDKVDFSARVQWVADHEREILLCGENPLENRWWTTADAPWQFLAWCIEWWKFRQEGLSFVSRIPIAMDGSNNGLQLYSLLTGSKSLALSTNVLPSISPRDIYSQVAASATLKLRSVATDGVGDAATGAAWVLRELYPDGLPRKLVKRPVMTLPYGVTKYSARRYVVDYIRDDCIKRGKKLPDGINHYEVLTTVGNAVWSVIEDGVEPAIRCMDWIRDCAHRCAAQDKPMTWVSPSGFPIYQVYERQKWTKINSILGDKIRIKKWMKLMKPTGEIDAKRMAQGAPPNFVHSLDAAIMSRAVSLCAREGITDFAIVHDSFAVPAADAPRLATALREAVVDVFKQDPLEQFAVSVETALGEPVERFRKDDEFNLELVKESRYIYA